MTAYLPGFVENGTATKSVLEGFLAALKAAPTGAGSVTLYYYSASVAGWRQIAPALKAWLRASKGREVTAFVGTDHGLTDPAVLAEMVSDGVRVHLLTNYSGIYHPKVIVLTGAAGGESWIGSHNLSEAAFRTNIEFGVRLSFKKEPAELAHWRQFIASASEVADAALIASYEKERNKFEKSNAKKPKFVWSKRKKAKSRQAHPPLPPSGALVMEIMPRETGADGKQVQFPMKSVQPVFRVSPSAGLSRPVEVRLVGNPSYHTVTLNAFKNKTARMVIAELDYQDRPCFLVLRRIAKDRYEYQIVSQAVEPLRFAQLQALPMKRTTPKSRWWTVI